MTTPSPHDRLHIVTPHDATQGFQGKDVCILISFSGDGFLRSGAYAYYQELIKNGIDVILCIIVDDLDLVRKEERLNDAASVIYRLNGGWDYAAWADIIRSMPQLWEAKQLYFTNDSVFCLPNSFSETVKRIRQSDADFIALTECGQIRHHTQSYFFVLQKNALTSSAIKDFWMNLKSLPSKGAVINAYEVTSLDMIKNADLSYDILFSYDYLFPKTPVGNLYWVNPTYQLWETLVYKGFPFIKVSLFTRNVLKKDIPYWKHLIAEYGADINACENHIKETTSYKPASSWRGLFHKYIRNVIYQSRITNKQKRIIKIFKIPVYKGDI